jgi:tetratricopeptide (TPR) repeat protein
MSKKKTRKKKGVVKPKEPLAISGYPSWFGKRKLHAWVFFCLGFLLYANSLTNEYALDDAIVITQNEFTQAGFAGFPGILQYDTFRGFFKKEGKEKLVSGGRYRPLTLLMFATEKELFGDNPFWGHLINCLLYGFTAFLLYLLLFQLLAPPHGKELATWVALGATLLFVTHPLHTEAVANIKGRDEIMALLGGLGAMYAVFRAIDGGRKGLWLALSAVFLLLGLFSKEHIITLAAILPLAIWYFRKPTIEKMLFHTGLILGTILIFLVIRGSVLGWNFGEPPMELMNNPFLVMVDGQMEPMPFGQKYATIVYTLGKYFQLLFVPYPLTHDYYPRHIDIMSFGDWQVLLSLLVYLGLIVAAIFSLKKRTIWGFGIWFYLLSLSIVSNIVFPVGTNMSERFLYMPSVGSSLAIAGLIFGLLRKQEKKVVYDRLQVGLWGIVLIALVFGLLTVLRNPAWKDDYTLFTTDVKVSENSAKVQNSVGGQLIERAESLEVGEERTALLQQAISHLERATEIHPYYKFPYHLMGNAFIYMGSYQRAVESYSKALAIDPGFLEATTNKGLAHTYLNQFAQAFAEFDKALAMEPGYPDALRYYGIAYREGGQFYGEQRNDLTTALRYLVEAEKRLPNDFETLRLLGVAYGSQGDNGKAIEYFDRALTLAPTDKDKAIILMNLGTAWYATDQGKAQNYYQQAQQIDPSVFKQ